ncbi:glycosyltransferase [Marinilongibacter aquaticus]|uniref:glycosyltransferase n=1 Tax=Marinilongibacter aquaticus TaxID=2975157 RepID=UPI0021BD34EE|nr:glycosyltransferase [Marinilongibacter aquaticus]UBM60726.1 glycosyltransferase [Marinilongibacter aquaticus]
MAKNNSVYYFDNPYTLSDLLKRRGSDECKRRKSFFKSLMPIEEKEEGGLKIYILPLMLSIHFLKEGPLYRKLLRLNEKWISRKISKVLRKEGVQDYVYINSFNFHYPEVAEGLLPKPDLTIYHCLDPIRGDFDAKHGIISEDVLVRNSDLIICSSQKLFNEKALINKNTAFIPNAANFEHSRKALLPDMPIHTFLKDKKKPVVGYFGSIDHRMDFGLMKEVCAQNKHMSFVFIGPVFEGIPEEIRKMSHVFFPGPMKYSELPSALKGFDVGIIPFKQEEHSDTVFPLKLFEYLGAGIAVVATNFNPDLADYTGDEVKYCQDAISFSKALNQCIDLDNEESKIRRVQLASDNTWENRAEEFEKEIKRHLP